jgi:hypothetical protein
MTCTGTEDCHRKQGLGEMNRQRSGVDRQMESGNGDFACGHFDLAPEKRPPRLIV